MTRPALAASGGELADLLADARGAGDRIALVPTMGALHAGHASLMSRARAEVGTGGRVVVSVFVNPLQFGAGEDLDRYPRTLDADVELCRREGVDVVFAPALGEVYPDGEPQVTVSPGPLGDVLEGRVRPGHFRGVLTVVAKLFGLVQPDVAVFGEKDYQQLVLIRRMVADLCSPVRVVGAETQREDDGLALSSRNRYLEPEQRRAATAISRALRAAAAAAPQGYDATLAAARGEMADAHGVVLDYLVITDSDLAEGPGGPPPGAPARILVAARLGTTRLIDNLALTLGGP